MAPEFAPRKEKPPGPRSRPAIRGRREPEARSSGARLAIRHRKGAIACLVTQNELLLVKLDAEQFQQFRRLVGENSADAGGCELCAETGGSGIVDGIDDDGDSGLIEQIQVVEPQVGWSWAIAIGARFRAEDRGRRMEAIRADVRANVFRGPMERRGREHAGRDPLATDRRAGYIAMIERGDQHAIGRVGTRHRSKHRVQDRRVRVGERLDFDVDQPIVLDRELECLE